MFLSKSTSTCRLLLVVWECSISLPSSDVTYSDFPAVRIIVLICGDISWWIQIICFSLEEHFLQRPVCHGKITFSRGRLSKCKAPGQVALESPRGLGERESSHEGRMPLQSGKMPTWTRREPTAFPTGPITELLGHEAPDNHQCHGSQSSKVITLLGNTTLPSCLCGSEAFVSVKARELENKGWEQRPPLSHGSLQECWWNNGEREFKHGAAFWCGLLLLITERGALALLIVTHQCPLIKHRHGFSYCNTHQLCCASPWSHFLLGKWILTAHILSGAS